MTRSLLALLGLGVFAVSAAAQEAAPTPAPQQPPAEEDVVKREEVVVVTASKVESTLINAPATVSVVRRGGVAERSLRRTSATCCGACRA